MVMNAYIFQIIIEKESQKLIKILPKSLILKTYRAIHKIEKKRIPSELVFLVMKIRKNIQFMYKKNVVKKKMLINY